jgi:NAD(P)-dependent dehydrogenase (short-subunit alcohol dehydrogenase family)
MVTARGGTGIWVQVDHTKPEQVKALFERVNKEQSGRLDILVNDIWGGDPLTEWGKPFWKHSLENGLLMQQRAVHTHIITSYYGVPIMVARHQGLVVEITDGDSYDLRGNLYYDLAKISAIRLAQSMARELRRYKVAALALTPGFLCSEAMLDHFGVTEANWQDATKRDPFFAASETPFYIGRAVVALASDPGMLDKTGQPLHVGDLAREYGFTDIDGRQPHCPQDFAEIRKKMGRFNISELRDIAFELGIEGYDHMRKGELYGVIEWTHPGHLERGQRE